MEHRAGADTAVTAAVAALVLLPLVAAAAALHGQHWWPTGDLAQAEMRVRSLWAHPPLIGAAGRLGTLGQRGSHPGPLAYWLLWPLYRLLGGTPWALEVSVLALNGTGFVATVAAARRVAGRAGALGAALALATLIHGFTLPTLVQPWNPFLPLVWFAAFVVLAWAVIAGDSRLWPALVAVGTLCVQCHVGYLGPVGGLGAVTLAVSLWRARRWPALVLAGGVGVALWIPPLVDQLTRHPGNAKILYDYFRHPPERAIGLGHGTATVLRLLNPAGGWATGRVGFGSNVLPGLALVGAWLAAAFATWRRRDRWTVLWALHVTVAAALVSTTLAVSRIFGQLFDYLVMWVWVVTAATIGAVAATIGMWAWPRVAGAASGRFRPAVLPAALAAVTAISVTAAWPARGLAVPYAPYSRQMAALVPAVVPKLDPHGRYRVTFDDPVSLGGDAYALVLELERRGITAGAPEQFHVAVEPHRVLTVRRATAVLVVVSGAAIDRWQRRPDARLVARVDPRTAAERARSDRLRIEAIDGLRAAGLDGLAPDVDGSLWLIANDRRTPPAVFDAVGSIIAMGLPTAVFELPPGAAETTP